MCDTVVAVGNVTADGSVIFGKNSNREPNEAHNIEYIPRKEHKANSKVKCTYLSIPQVKETYSVLLLKPFWMFGCEMGANEFGVTIGNEAVWSKEPIRKKGLLGMDLMRLALERSKTAKEALETITSLLQLYGQGGQCSYTVIGRDYHNSFIIADPNEAWVLETADKYWIAEKVKGVRTISNTLTIETEYDLIHPELISHAIEKGYTKKEEEFNFAMDFIPKFRFYHAFKETKERAQYFAKGLERHRCTTALMLKNKGKITPTDVINVLRNHNITKEEESKWTPSKATATSPCHHAKSITVPDQTVGSLVSHIKKNIQVHWVTGSSAPCISTYKPIFFPRPGLTKKLTLAGAQFNAESFWWMNEKFHRLVILDYQKRLQEYKTERDKQEEILTEKVQNLLLKISDNPNEQEIEEMGKITRDAFSRNIQIVQKWTKIFQESTIEEKTNLWYRMFWAKQNKLANVKINRA